MATKTASKKSAGLKLERIERVILYVRDTMKAASWYSKTLGLKVRFAEPGWAELETKGTILSLHGGRKSAKPIEGCASVSFHVDDFDAAHRALKLREVKVGAVAQPCHDTRYACFTDPDGNELSIEGR